MAQRTRAVLGDRPSLAAAQLAAAQPVESVAAGPVVPTMAEPSRGEGWVPGPDFDDALRASASAAVSDRGSYGEFEDLDGEFDLVDGTSIGAARWLRALIGRFVAAQAGFGWLRRTRFDPGRRGAVAVGVTALIVALLAGAWVLFDRPHAAAVVPRVVSDLSSGQPTSRSSGSTADVTGRSGAPAGSASATTSNKIVVDVVGQVKAPGIYQLPAGARVADALAAAGGPLPGVDLTTVNLARRLSDGEQVAIGVPGAPASAGPVDGGVAGSVSSSAPVDLNTASIEQLDGLPGVGPVLAQHILDWRTAHGRFASVDQLREVSGIGPAKFADIKGLVTV